MQNRVQFMLQSSLQDETRGPGPTFLLSFCLWPRAFRILLPSLPYWFLLRAPLNELLIFVQEFLSLAPRKLDYDRFQTGSHLWWLISCVNLTGLRDTQEATGLTSGWVCRVSVNRGSIWIGRLGNDGPHQCEWASWVSWRPQWNKKDVISTLRSWAFRLAGRLTAPAPWSNSLIFGLKRGLTPSTPLILRFDLNYTTGFLGSSQLADSRSWDFVVSIIRWTDSYK